MISKFSLVSEKSSRIDHIPKSLKLEVPLTFPRKVTLTVHVEIELCSKLPSNHITDGSSRVIATGATRTGASSTGAITVTVCDKVSGSGSINVAPFVGMKLNCTLYSPSDSGTKDN